RAFLVSTMPVPSCSRSALISAMVKLAMCGGSLLRYGMYAGLLGVGGVSCLSRSFGRLSSRRLGSRCLGRLGSRCVGRLGSRCVSRLSALGGGLEQLRLPLGQRLCFAGLGVVL